VQHLHEKLFTGSVRHTEQRFSEFIAQSLANTAWAFATVELPWQEPFTASAGRVELRLGEVKTQNLASTACAFAMVMQPC